MKYGKATYFPDLQALVPRALLAVLVVSTLSACPVDSTTVDDANLIVDFMVQNDNGRVSALVTLASKDLAGSHKVDLVAGESISYEHNGRSDELNKRADGKYGVDLSSDAYGWGSFILTRRDNDGPLIFREINDNEVYLPQPFEAMQAEPVQSGPVIIISWSEVDTPQSIDGISTLATRVTFNAIASCQNQNGPFDVAITDGQITQQNKQSGLEIPVTAHLSQVLELPAEMIETSSCEFDVQMVRNITGRTDSELHRDSTATGQALQNTVIRWTPQ